MKIVKLLIVLLMGNFSIFSQSLINNEDNFYKIEAKTEIGFIWIVNHTLQNGNNGTNFNFVTQGGQDILFPITRYELGLDINKHKLKFLYQPLEISTSVNFFDDVVVDNIIFKTDTPMDVKYSFPFWRITYLYDLIASNNLNLGVGGALQIRNASIVFSSKNGEQITVSQNVGPVPALSFYVSKSFKNGISLDFDATGSYAAISVLNGSSFSFEGSLLDSSLSVNFNLKNGMQWYILGRFLGGSATGNSEYIGGTWSESRSAYTDNQLQTIVISTGLKLK